MDIHCVRASFAVGVGVAASSHQFPHHLASPMPYGGGFWKQPALVQQPGWLQWDGLGDRPKFML